MKTKIVYISGNEIFDMAEIRDAFDAVRNALNLGKDTVLFGVPVDSDDAGLVSQSDESATISVVADAPKIDVVDKDISENTVEIESIVDMEQSDPEPVIIEKPEKKRTRTKKVTAVASDNEESAIQDDNANAAGDNVVPILSILSGKDADDTEIPETENEESGNVLDIIEDITPETEGNNDIEPDYDVEEAEESDSKTDLEKLLSEMQPLAEDVTEDQPVVNNDMAPDESDDGENIDATLEKLATEFVQTQDKIASETKSSNRSKIGKLRNILPFKQSKHHDQGLGDLFGWAGVAANDDEFAVPGFFTTKSSKK